MRAEVDEATFTHAPGSVGLLSVRDVHRDFGGVRACNGVTFAVKAGHITGLIGPNGAGKSTMVGIISGALRSTSGSLLFDSVDVTRVPAHLRARLGLTRTFQLSSEFAKLTVLENLVVAAPRQAGESLWGALLGKAHWLPQEQTLVERARELLVRFAMSEKEDEYAGNLSGGQKRLVEIMRALMAQPKLLLLDEPMAGVHPNLAQRIVQYLEELRDSGLTMLLVEHELGVVERLCEPVIVMAEGKVIAEGSMHEMRQHAAVVDAYLGG